MDWSRLKNKFLKTRSNKDKRACNTQNSYYLSLFRMGLFGAAHGWGGGRKHPPPLNLSHIFYKDETWQLHLT